MEKYRKGGMFMNEEKRPFYKKWWFILIALLLFFAAIGGILDSLGVQTEKEKETIAKQEEKEKAKKEEEERIANRTIDEILEEDEKDVDRAEFDDGVLTIEKDVTTFLDETSIFKIDVLKMFEILPKAFEDENVDRVNVVLNMKMTDNKGKSEMEPVIFYEYSREDFEELDYDNFLWMATSETWRIFNESTSYEIYGTIYKNVDEDYKNKLINGISKIEE